MPATIKLTDAEILTFAKAVAKELGKGWTAKLDDHRIHLYRDGKQVAAFSQQWNKNTLHVFACLPWKDEPRDGSGYRLGKVREDNATSINVSHTRGAAVVAKDFTRRLLPVIDLCIAAAAEDVRAHNERINSLDAMTGDLLTALGKLGRRCNDFNGKSTHAVDFYRFNDGLRGKFTPSTYKDGTCKIELENVPHALAVTLGKLLAAEIAKLPEDKEGKKYR